MGYGPYVPVQRLLKILDQYQEDHGITAKELCAELSAGTMVSEEAWARRLYSWRSGETASVRFPIADNALTALGLTDRWYSELNDIYVAA